MGDVTLWQIYVMEGGAPSAPLARALLSDANIALLTRVLQAKATTELGELSPQPQNLTLTHCDAFSNAIMDVALKQGWMGLSASSLTRANQEVIKHALLRLTTEQNQFAVWKRYLERGGSDAALVPRPETDEERADRKELQRGPLGHNISSPWDTLGPQLGITQEYKPFNGFSARDISGSDDLRVQVVPWAPPYSRHPR